MPLQKLQYRPGVNREGTTLSNEGGWFDCDKIRFRSGYPEKIGGWVGISTQKFVGICRSLWNWITLKGYNLMGVGTESKFYIENGGTYYDITPIRRAIVLTNPFTTNNLSSIVSVTDQNHGAISGDYVTFTGATAVGGITVNGQYVITYVDSNIYTIDTLVPASSSATGGGTVTAQYQINNGAATGGAQTGWGAGYWGGVITGAQINQLSSAINASVTTIPVSSTSGFPAAGLLLIDNELISYTGTSGGNSFTGCTRGAFGTTAASHLINALVTDASNYYGWGQSASQTTNTALRLWSQMNYGEDLLYNPRGGSIYLWQPGSSSTPAFTTRGTVLGPFSATINTTNLSTTITVTKSFGYLAVGDTISGTGIPVGATIATGSGYTGTFTISAAATATNTGITATVSPQSSVTNTSASTAPTVCNEVFVSDATRIVIAFGCNEIGSTVLDPLFIRWSDQENYNEWTPSATNQAGSYRLSHGSTIVGVLQTRQEILIWTDTALYSMQYLGAPYVFGFTLLADNISVTSPNAMTTASGVTYWMGTDKFYVYSGRTETLPCAVRTYVYDNANMAQGAQFFCSTNEGFSEVWWFYCSIAGPDGTGTIANPNKVLDSYVIFNYLDRVWYYGTMQRTAWVDSPLRQYPIAASYTNQLVAHENGVNDATDPGTPLPISCYVQSSDFDIGDGHNFGFVWQIVPDITFDGSQTQGSNYPQAVFTVRPRRNPGANYGTSDTPIVASTQSYNNQYAYNVQQFTQVVNARLRGRQMAFRISSNTLGTQWQLGTPRINVRPDGRK